MERSVHWHRDEDCPRLPPSNAHTIFKRTFETEFGQKSLKIGRILAAYRAITPGLCAPQMPPRIVLPQKCRRLAAARRPRYIESGFPLNPRLKQRALSALPKARRARAKDTQPKANNGPPIHLSHGRFVQDLSGQPQGLGEHQSVVLSRRQDRRARRQWLRQIDAAAHHGGARPGLFWRSLGSRGRPRRLSGAGAAARSRQVRAR